MSRAAVWLFALLLSGCVTMDTLRYSRYRAAEKQAIVMAREKISVNEASGIIKGSRHVWVVGDSGNRPVLHGIDPENGRKTAARVRGARNRDWEDLAIDDSGMILIADTGNNLRPIKRLRIYAVSEPGGKGDVPVRGEMRLLMPKGSKTPNCEALFVSGKRIYLLTKKRNGRSELLSCILPRDYSGELKLEKLGEIVTEYPVTGADSRGDEVVILTYGAIITATLTVDGIRTDDIYIIEKDKFGKCEGICFSGEDSDLLVVNENGYMIRVRLEEGRIR